MVVRGAGIDDVEHHALALLHPERFAVPEHPAVDRGRAIGQFVAGRHLAGVRIGVRRDGDEVQFHAGRLHEGRVVVEPREIRLELLECQEHLAVVGAGVVPWFDVDGSGLAGIQAARKVGARAHMGVVETQARRHRREDLAAMAVGRYRRRAFLERAVHAVGQELAVPVHLLGMAGVVEDVDDGLHALPETQQRTRKDTVVERGRHEPLRGEFQHACRDAQGVVSLAIPD